MGIVYRATDTVLGREVAVKVLQEHYETGSAVALRFVDEARITGQLQHPGVPAVHDLGTLPDGRPFLAMKLIKGRTLEALLRDRADPAQERGRLVAAFEHVCQAVGYAHAHGVVHRDLKPGNVMVGAFGEVQVMDWGLAKLLTGGRAAGAGSADPGATTAKTAIRPAREWDDETRVGSVLGTPAYMPPEQAIGAVDQIDQRSDVFGLGATLCAILTGGPPYVGADGESTRQLAARAKLDNAFARLDACGAEPGLVALCKRCLAAEKADRPADAGEVAQAVNGLRAAADERARKAELERAAAETRAAEEARTRQAEKAKVAVEGWLRRLAVVLVACLVSLAAGLWSLSSIRDNIAKASALKGASQQAEFFSEVNSSYSDVAQRAVAAGVEVTHDYYRKPQAIPIPPTFTIELGQQISDRSETGAKIRLYSDYPFRSRRGGGPRDDFEREALSRLRDEPTQPVYRFEDYEGRPVLRYATAQLMRATCVNCHNTHPDSPKKDWKVGDVRGVLEITSALYTDTEVARRAVNQAYWLMGGMAVGTALVLTLCGFLLSVARRRRGRTRSPT
jgi:hypothetical protein